MQLTPRHLRRYRQIIEVLVGHGFGAVLAQLELDPRLDLPRRLLYWRQSPPVERSPAEHVRLALEELGGTFVKLGQILSTRPDLLPPSYVAELSRLQDEVPPDAWEPIKARIEEELGDTLEKLFSSFEPEPIAAASLAQVHAATLPTGQEVVVKVQRPGIERMVNIDLDILYDMAQLAQQRTVLGELYNLVDLADEFSASLRAELDYRREGRNADRFRNNFADEEHLYVPTIYWDYTTRRVLVLERISGIKINNIDALDAAGYDRHRIALHSAHFIIQEVLEDGFFHADPHPGNIVILPNEVIGLMDFGMVGHLAASDRSDLVRLYVVAVQMDVEGLVDQLVQIGVADAHLDRAGLRRDIRRLLLKYQGLPLQEISAKEVLDEIRPIIYRYHLRFPNDLWMLAKTLVMMEGVGQKLDPGFDIFAVSEPYVRRFMLQMWLPSSWGPPLLRSASSWGNLISDMPLHANRLIGQVERGELGLNIQLVEIDKTINRLDGIANRVILSVLLAAFIVALALLIPTLNLAWPWGLLTWIIILGFGIMSILGLWLIISILRSGRAG